MRPEKFTYSETYYVGCETSAIRQSLHENGASLGKYIIIFKGLPRRDLKELEPRDYVIARYKPDIMAHRIADQLEKQAVGGNWRT